MTANPHADQMAAEVRDKMAAEPDVAKFTAAARAMSAGLTSRMPDLPPEVIGTVALYASSYLGTSLDIASEARGVEMCPTAMNLISMLAMVGEQLYHQPKTSGA